MQSEAKYEIEDYLDRVNRAISFLPDNQKEDILRGVESQIYEALDARTGGREASLADVNAVISEMDLPESYAQAARDSMSCDGRPSGRIVFGKRIPGTLLFGLAALAVMVVGKLIAAISVGKPTMLIDFVLSGLILVGLYYGNKAAYVLTIVAVLFGTIGTAVKVGLGAGMLVFLIDCLVLVPVILSTEYFFPPRASRSSQEDHDSPIPRTLI